MLGHRSALYLLHHFPVRSGHLHHHHDDAPGPGYPSVLHHLRTSRQLARHHGSCGSLHRALPQGLRETTHLQSEAQAKTSSRSTHCPKQDMTRKAQSYSPFVNFLSCIWNISISIIRNSVKDVYFVVTIEFVSILSMSRHDDWYKGLSLQIYLIKLTWNLWICVLYNGVQRMYVILLTN